MRPILTCLLLSLLTSCATTSHSGLDVHLTAKQLGVEKDYANAYVKMKEVDFATVDVDLYLGQKTSRSSGQDAFEAMGYGAWIQFCPIWIVAVNRKFNGAKASFVGNGPFLAPIKGRVQFFNYPADEKSPSKPSRDIIDLRLKETDMTLSYLCPKFALDAKMLGL